MGNTHAPQVEEPTAYVRRNMRTTRRVSRKQVEKRCQLYILFLHILRLLQYLLILFRRPLVHRLCLLGLRLS